MKAWLCWSLAGPLAVLGLLVAPESVREARRLSRLQRDGLQVTAQVTAIERYSVSTTHDTDRARYGQSMPVEDAVMRYSVAGRDYEARHRLPEPLGRHRVGDAFLLVVLADDPARSYAPGEVTGNRIMSFALPLLLLLGAGVFGGVGALLRSVKPLRAPRATRPR